MSNLLKEAIVDAKALRESALKNAETVVIEKYSEEVKETLQKLLEQEDDLGMPAMPGAEPAPAADPLAAEDPAMADPALDAMPMEDPMAAEGEEAPEEGLTDEEIPLGATDDFAELDGENLGNFSAAGTTEPLTIDLGALQESIEALKQSLDEDEEIDLSEFLNEEGEEELGEAGLGKGIGQAIAGTAKLAGKTASVVGKGVGSAVKHSGKAISGLGKGDDEEELDERFGGTMIASKAVKDAAKKGPFGGGIASKLGLGDDDEELEEQAEDDDDDTLGDKAAGQAASAGLDGLMSAMTEESDQDALIDAIVEKLTVDMGADLSGWAGRSSASKRREIEKEMAHRRSTDVEEEMKDLKKAQEELVFENNQLTEKLSEYQAAIGELKEGLQDTNLSNARLLYTNRVLRNTSLNERQKDKIAEAISNAGSVTDAKTIYDTLQSTVEAKPKKSPQSLSEAIGRRNTVLRATRKEEPASDPFQNRMKRLAGIK